MSKWEKSYSKSLIKEDKDAMTKFHISGSLIDRLTKQGLPGLRVEAWDKDMISNDLLGSAITDEQGNFQIEFDESYFRELFLDRQPDLFFRVFDNSQLIKSTEDSVFWNLQLGETKMMIEVDRPDAQKFEKQRQQFRALILSNPNYFGNLKDSQFKPVLEIQSNTFYEQLGCVGFQPQFNRLEAVVFIKRPFGYGGDVCSKGTPEYVRFYLSFDEGATWVDQGLTSFSAYDIPEKVTDGQRLEYAVSLQVNPPRKFCFIRNLAHVRAILSWNAPPPPNEPDFIPVWGNVEEVSIQIEPRQLIVLKDLFQHLEIKTPPELSTLVNLSQPLEAIQPKAFGAVELKDLYKDKDVPPHRFALSEVKQLMNQPALTESLMASNATAILSKLDINLADIVDQLFPVDGSTRYEELECVGLYSNPDTVLDTLIGIIRVKLPSGYSGGPCTAGSREYVTFWADFNNDGSFATCLGTTSVKVYDIDDIPKGGLSYAVFLPVNLNQYEQPCQKGAKVVRIRAILSWEEAPPCDNPNFIPIWGNREETLIHIKPGIAPQPGTYPPLIETVGSMGVGSINAATGLATGSALLAGFVAKDSPFGGEVVITGHIGNPTDISSGAIPLKYRVSISNDGWITKQNLTNKFTIGRSQLLDGIWTVLPNLEQTADADSFYTYREDLTGGTGNAQIFVAGNVLARWQTGSLTGLWQIRVEAKDPANNLYLSTPVTVYLDNAAPQFPVGSFKITSGGGSCADFKVGDVIEGTYAVTDEHFGSLNLMVLPALGGTFTSPVPLPRTYPTVSTTGESGIWKLNTAGMPKCGYVVRLSASDRTIVNSGSIGFYNETFVGLCLRTT
ncbi:MAG TPA: hypothetical protein DDZ80_11745 [Cyanobacteria bacterium UBA8803]|nr:hypothetical protein [Cyanobacteria bacterium UBA9273]HBL59156.1 hypothetical protein [Cyanobacteria bacterium UBA8803]